VSAELLKHGKDFISTELSHLFNLIWQAEDVPEDWRNGVIVTLPKKRNLSDCSNMRGIKVIISTRKGLLSVIKNWLKEAVDLTVREEQASFRRERSYCKHIFIHATVATEHNRTESRFSITTSHKFYRL